MRDDIRKIDMFSGALIRMGKELGIPTPYNEYTHHMIKALEEKKNDGKFDYTGPESGNDMGKVTGEMQMNITVYLGANEGSDPALKQSGWRNWAAGSGESGNAAGLRRLPAAA